MKHFLTANGKTVFLFTKSFLQVSAMTDNSYAGESSGDISASEPSQRKRKKRMHCVDDFTEADDTALTKAKENIAKKNKLLKLERQRTARMQKKNTEWRRLHSRFFHRSNKMI